MNKKKIHGFCVNMIAFCIGMLSCLTLISLTYFSDLFGVFNLYLWIIIFSFALVIFTSLYSLSMPPPQERVFDPRLMPKNLVGIDEWGAYLEEIETD